MSAVETSFEFIAVVDELLGEILVRLPINYLCHCKLVNKKWQSLIYSPWFRHLRLRRPAPPSFILTSYSGKVFYLCFDEKILHPLNFSFVDGKIIQWCNGLMLVEKINNEISTYAVYNPTTGKSRVLPRISSVHRSSKAMYLVYEPSKSPNYKVIATMAGAIVRIYESEFRNWVTSEIRLHGYTIRNGVYCNDTVYMVEDIFNYRQLYNPAAITLKYLDLKTKMIENLPRLAPDGYKFPHFLASNGQLYIVFEQMNNGVILVFELLECGTGWLETCRVDLMDSGCKHSVLTIVRGTTREKSFVLIEKLGNIISYPFSGDGVEIIFDWTKWNQYKWARSRHWARKCHWENVYNFMETYDPV